MPKIVFDERIAKTYDASSADMFEPALLESTVAFLAARAGDGAALELGIGTGRVALPLSQRGKEPAKKPASGVCFSFSGGLLGVSSGRPPEFALG